LIATWKKENLIPIGSQEGPFKAYDARLAGMISDLVKKLNQLEPTDWTEATSITAWRNSPEKSRGTGISKESSYSATRHPNSAFLGITAPWAAEETILP
jgi:hypothetical protein